MRRTISLRASANGEAKAMEPLKGEIVLMGSSTELEDNVMGDTVNCASRLESLARVPCDQICRALFSRQTLLEYHHDGL